jgi:hypothetical protein
LQVSGRGSKPWQPLHKPLRCAAAAQLVGT